MKTISLKKLKKINLKKEYAKRYLLKYIKELKLHFDLSENEIREILREIYYSASPIFKIIKLIGKYFKEETR